MEEKLTYMRSQNELKSRKIDDLEHYRYQQSVRFSGCEVKENKYKEECEHVVKNYIKNSLNFDVKAEC